MIGVKVHSAVQLVASPTSTSAVQLSPSLQRVGHEDGGSQVSPDSTMPLPQTGPTQSLSVAVTQPAGQHPSPSLHVVISTKEHDAVHDDASPLNTSVVQLFPSSHDVGHEDGGSQVSPASWILLPQVGEQSLSLLALQPAGQQPSPSTQLEIGG